MEGAGCHGQLGWATPSCPKQPQYRCHTTLKARASLLDKVVFLADKLSWDQAGESPFKEAVNAALSKSLDAACLAYIRWLLGPEGGVRVVHPWLKAALYDLKKRC